MYRDGELVPFRPLRCTRSLPNDDLALWGAFVVALTLLAAYLRVRDAAAVNALVIVGALWGVFLIVLVRILVRRLRWRGVRVSIELAEPALIAGDAVRARIAVPGAGRDVALTLAILARRGPAFVIGRIARAGEVAQEIPLVADAATPDADYVLLAIVDDGGGTTLEAQFEVDVLTRGESSLSR
jgi:hypothetical protein